MDTKISSFPIYRRRQVYSFIIDETMIKIDRKHIWIWISIYTNTSLFSVHQILFLKIFNIFLNDGKFANFPYTFYLKVNSVLILSIPFALYNIVQ